MLSLSWHFNAPVRARLAYAATRRRSQLIHLARLGASQESLDKQWRHQHTQNCEEGSQVTH